MPDEYKHQSNYVDRQKKKGLISLRVWIPSKWKQKLKDYAQQLRSEYKSEDNNNES